MIVDKRRNSGAVKWSPAHAEAIETGNGGRRGVMASQLSSLRIFYFFLFPTIPYSPSRSCCQTHIHTHIQTHHTSRSFIPWRWECDINQSVPITPVTPTVPPAPPPNPRSAFLLLPSLHRSGEAAVPPQWALVLHSQGGSERRVKWVAEREAAEVKSCLGSSLTDTGVLKNVDSRNYHTAHLKQS